MDYAPDYPIRTPGLLYDVNNFVPTATAGYQTSAPPVKVQNLDNISAGLAVGAQAVLDINGTHVVMVGTLNKAYAASGGGFSAVSATSYSLTTANGIWTFATMGDALLGANGVSELQRSTTMVGGSIAFTDLAGSPKARIIFNHENSIVALNINGNPDGWACSDTGDYTQWSAAPGNNADAGDLTGGGGGGIIAGTTWQKLALAWKYNCLIGGIRVEEIDQAIRWEMLDDSAGCVSPFAWVKTEVGVFYCASRDVMLFDGSKPRSIAGKIRREFLTQTKSYQSSMFMTHDEIEKNIYIWYAVDGSSDNGYPNRAFVFNYVSGKWGKVSDINSSDQAFTSFRCPVLNTSRQLGATYTTDSGVVTFADLQTNWLMAYDGIGSPLVNVAHRTTAKTRSSTRGKPSFTTGYIGTPEVDTTLSRLYIVPEVAGTDPESGALNYVAEDATVRTVAASVNDMGMLDGVRASRYFQASAVWPTSTGRQIIAEVMPKFEKVAKGR